MKGNARFAIVALICNSCSNYKNALLVVVVIVVVVVVTGRALIYVVLNTA